MPDNGVQENTRFDGRKKNEKADVKKILQPRLAIVNSYTLIAVVYCISSSILFFSVVDNYLLSAVHLLALLSVVTNYFVLLRTKNFKRATNTILITGTIVVVSLFATGGWQNTGYLWPFAYLPYAFFLTERHTVMHWIVALFSGCVLAVLLHIGGAITIPYSPVAITNFFAALLIFTMCMLLFQKATVKREEFLSYTGALLEAAPDAVIVINGEGQVIKWNDKAETLFGWAETEVTGRLLSSIIIPLRYREAHKKGLQHFLETGEGPVLHKSIEIKALNKNSDEFDVSLSISPVLIKDKYQFIGFVRDITEQKKAEEKFRSLLDSAPDAMVIVNEQGEIALINVQTETLFGYHREELIGQKVEILIPDRFLGNHVHHRESFSSSPKTRNMGTGLELFGKKKDGKEFPVEISLSPLKTGEGLLVSAAIRDITERKKAEAKFKGLLESAPDAMVIVNKEGIVQLVNAQTEKLFGYSRNEIIGKQVEILIPKRFAHNHPDHRTGYFAHPNIRGMGEGLELFGMKRGGEEFPVEISLSPLETEEGLLVSAAIRDMTEKKKLQSKLMNVNVDLEEKVRQRTEQLEIQKTELEQFAYIASHDLQEPLRMVASYMQLLKNRYKDKLDSDAHEFIHFAVDGAARMKQLINDLLNYSRTSRETQTAEVDISKVIDDVKKNLTTSIIESNAKINHNGMPYIKADRTQMLQLFQNLISNAIKFRKDDEAPVIHVKAIEENSHWVFSVSDNGIGIEKEYSDKIFIIFKQLNDKAKYGGTGIGLAIAKKIVERHRGKIWFESELGKGTTFFFTLKNL